MNTPEPSDRDRHNQWVEELASEIDFEPLKLFILQLKEEPEDGESEVPA